MIFFVSFLPSLVTTFTIYTPAGIPAVEMTTSESVGVKLEKTEPSEEISEMFLGTEEFVTFTNRLHKKFSDSEPLRSLFQRVRKCDERLCT